MARHRLEIVDAFGQCVLQVSEANMPDHRRRVDRLAAGQRVEVRHSASSKLLLAGSGGRRATIRTRLFERDCKDRGLPITSARDLPRPAISTHYKTSAAKF